MQNKINVLNESESEMEFTFLADEIKDDIQKEVDKQVKKIQIDGFRKGKAPRSVIKKLYGDSLEYDAAEKVANDKFWNETKSQNIKPLGEPVMTEFDYKPGGELKFKVKYETYPVVELKQYKGIEISVPKFAARDEEVEEQFKNLMSSRATLEDAETVEGNLFQVTLDLQSKDEKGEPILGGEYKGLTVDLSRSTTNPQIAENSQGKKVGESFEFVFIDAHTHKKDDGTEEEHKEEKRFDATITKIQRQVLPSIDEEFVQSITRGEYSDEAGLKKYIREVIEFRNNENTEQFIISQLNEELIKLNDFAVPKTLIDFFYEKIFKDEKERRGKNFKPTKEFEERLREDTINMFKIQLLKDIIIDHEKLQLTDEIVDQFVQEDAKILKVPYEKLRPAAENEAKKSEYTSRLFRNFLKENNKINYVNHESDLEEGN